MKSKIAIICLFWGVLSGCGLIESPRQVKLIECKSNITTVQFTCPPGKSFRFLLGVPESKIHWSSPDAKIPPKPSFQGKIIIESLNEGNVNVSFPILPDNITRSNWLQQHGVEGGYILSMDKVPNGPDFGEPLDSYIKPKQIYKVKIIFFQQPPPETSFWLSWLG